MHTVLLYEYKNKIPLNSFIKVAAYALLFCFAATFAHAAPIKHRGNIKSVDVAAKTLVLEKKKGDVTLKWDDDTRLRSSTVSSIGDLKPGMFILNFVKEEDGETIITIRHQPENDK